MFGTLLESHPPVAGSRWGIAFGVALHGLALAVLLLRPVSAARAVEVHPPIELPPLPPERVSHPVSPPATPTPPIIAVPNGTIGTIPLPGPFPGVPEIPIAMPGSPTAPLPTGPAPIWWTSDTVPRSVLQEVPVLLQAPIPAYPTRMREAGIEGNVVIEVVVDTLGHAEPGSLRVVSSDHAEFAAPARASIAAAMFRPARVMGRPVRVLVRVPVGFRIRR